MRTKRKPVPSPAEIPTHKPQILNNWTSLHSRALLTALTIICLLPFCGKAFHIDDPMFLWPAQQVVKHPLDPYGFKVLWYMKPMLMSEVATNPPLASYYIAMVASVIGWSEKALHFAFLLPALAVILGTYSLARRFTRNPLLAAAATLLAPGFLVSSTNVMCDTMMLAAWILATLLWLKGFDRKMPLLLLASATFIAVASLTKYYAVALILLLLAYSIARDRRVGLWILYLLLPLCVLVAYQYGTQLLYGKGLLLQAVDYANHERVDFGGHIAKTFVGLSFLGGCAISALFFAPVLWSRRTLLFGSIAAGLAILLCAMGWIHVSVFELVQDNRASLSAQFVLFITAGISILALAFLDWRKRRDADSLFLALWVLGTFVFATFVNWTVNGRSVLPLIPAAAILLARRFDLGRPRLLAAVVPLAAAAIVSVWVTSADARLADSAREAAQYVRDHPAPGKNTSFEGHWGFQYYMQLFGFAPLDFDTYEIQDGNLVVIPENSTNTRAMPPQIVASQSIYSIDVNLGVTTMGSAMGAGFYSDAEGPLPYAFGPAPPERYLFDQMKLPEQP
jgi:hypothetical protein